MERGQKRWILREQSQVNYAWKPLSGYTVLPQRMRGGVSGEDYVHRRKMKKTRVAKPTGTRKSRPGRLCGIGDGVRENA